MLSVGLLGNLDKVVCIPPSPFSPDASSLFLTPLEGHAIWIGNLPPQTDLMNLVHHVCKETSGLESLFLISKSNCAFANFKDEQSCAEAQQKLHDSRFETVRLVSRLRKSTVEGAAGVSAPTGPAASTSQGSPAQVTSPEGNSESERSIPAPDSVGERHAAPTAEGPTQQKDSFFILKSLTLEDLELSVRTGIWATQSHNEENLNKAFEVSGARACTLASSPAQDVAWKTFER